MENDLKSLLRIWSRSPISRRSLLGAMALTVLAESSIGKAFGVTTPSFTQILGRPTSNSISLSILANESISAYLEYGYAKGKYGYKSSSKDLSAGTPGVYELTGLKANSKIYYRVRTKTNGVESIGKEYSFSTQKKTGTTFSFTVQGDTHPERAGKMFNSELYYVTMSNIAKQQPDFHILLGDDFSIDPLIDKGQANQANVEQIYKTHRNWLGVAGSSVPIYLVNGNHEQAAAYLLDGSKTNPAVLAGNARNKFYPLPTPGKFYSGDTYEIPGVGLPRDYYAWTWGDALFLTLDPYWHSKFAVDNVAGVLAPEDQTASAISDTSTVTNKKGGAKAADKPAKPAGGGAAKVDNLWKVGIGDEQYAWFKKTLETSKAKYKFVFAHHVLGTGRGAVEVSTNYEWGGADPKGTSTFAKERPNWSLPIHDLMVKNGVQIFFQGHDHIFCTQERDGLIYQSMPNPADDTFSMFNESAYKSGFKAPNSGHARIVVSPAEAKVEYFLAARPSDSGRTNMQLAHSYVVKPK